MSINRYKSGWLTTNPNSAQWTQSFEPVSKRENWQDKLKLKLQAARTLITVDDISLPFRLVMKLSELKQLQWSCSHLNYESSYLIFIYLRFSLINKENGIGFPENIDWLQDEFLWVRFNLSTRQFCPGSSPMGCLAVIK